MKNGAIIRRMGASFVMLALSVLVFEFVCSQIVEVNRSVAGWADNF